VPPGERVHRLKWIFFPRWIDWRIRDSRPKAGVGTASIGYCQVNEIETVQPIDGYIPLLLGHNLCARHLLPCTKCPRAKLAIVKRSRQVPTQSEQIAYHAINRKKALSLSSRFEPPHLSFALASWFM
jgi:hypothetical protein